MHLFTRTATRTSRSPKRSVVSLGTFPRRLAIESLESRCLLAVFGGIDPAGALTIDGDAGDNVIEISATSPQPGSVPWLVVIGDGAVLDTIPAEFPTSDVTSITVNGGAGNDTILLGSVAPGNGFNFPSDWNPLGTFSGKITLDGDLDEDLIIGSEFSDEIRGGLHRDVLHGGGGADFIYGGDGNDTIEGGEGIDQIYGGQGNDHIEGGSEGDYLYGGSNNDLLADGADTIYGDDGDDFISGGPGGDTLSGGDGCDTLYAHSFEEEGDAGDTGNGDYGDDTIENFNPAATIKGGSGQDRIDGMLDNDPPEGCAHSIELISALNLQTTEQGGKATFSVKLGGKPMAAVTVPVASNDTSEGTVSITQLVFQPEAWDTAQPVEVTGVDDLNDDGHKAYSILLGPTTRNRKRGRSSF